MAQQPIEKKDNKVALDMADLPLPKLGGEEKPEEDSPPVEISAFDSSTLAPDEEEKRGLPKLLLMGGGAAVVLVLLALVWFLFLRADHKEPEPASESPATRGVSVGPPRVTLEPFLVPVMPDPRGRLLKIAVMLEFNSVEDMDSTLLEKTPLIRDAIYLSLRGRSLEDINSARLNNILPAQIKERINKSLGADIVKHIYFPDFLFVG